MTKASLIEVYQLTRPNDTDEVGIMKNFAREVFDEIGHLTFEALVRGGDGKLFAVSPDVDIDKQAFVYAVRTMASRFRADMVVTCMEAWMARGASEKMPSEREDREECVVIFVESPTGSSMYKAGIDRAGEKPKLREFEQLEVDSLGGAMACLLPTN